MNDSNSRKLFCTTGMLGERLLDGPLRVKMSSRQIRCMRGDAVTGTELGYFLFSLQENTYIYI